MKSLRESMSIALLSAMVLCLLSLPAQAQDDSVTISAAEFQRMVYSSHLLTQLDEKPELDASLHVLFELQRHNPHADPVALASVLQEAVAGYRANAPSYLKAFNNRNEILATYLEAFLQVPARTNFVPVNLSLLNYFMLGPEEYATASAAELIHSGNQRLLTTETANAHREELVKMCTLRASENDDFSLAMDSLLWPEIGAVLAHTPDEILGLNSALSNSPTMQLMLERNYSSPDGSVTLSTNDLKNLFVQEMDLMHEIIETNQAVLLEILATKTDLTSYLINTDLIEANSQREAAVKQGQAQRFAAAHAAVMMTGDLTARKSPLLSKHMINVGRSVKGIFDGVKSWNEGGSMMKGLATGNFVAAGLGLIGVFLDISGPTPEQMIMDELADIKGLINDLSINMNYRFDRLDEDLNAVLDQLTYSINLIGEVGHDVTEVRNELLDVQTDLHRIERHLNRYLSQLYARHLNVAFNTWLNYEVKHLGQTMDADDYRDEAEPIYYTHTVNNSLDEISSPYTDRDYTPSGLYWELTESGSGVSNRLDQNLRYVKKYLNDNLGQPTATGIDDLANPRDWFVGAYAYLQLASENPKYYRYEVDPVYGLDHIAPIGQDLVDFFRSLTFDGTNINWSLHNALENYYAAELNEFNDQVQTVEQQYANTNSFALDTWRLWSAAAPRITTATTEVLTSPAASLPSIPRDAVDIAAGRHHSLALKADGTVVAWGSNDEGQTTISPHATNVASIECGMLHSLAVRSDRRVIAWGDNSYGQTNVSAGATNVSAVSGGHYHNLALRADGQVIAWGAGTNETLHSFPHYKQSVVPAGATNITAIAAGGYHSLALRADGTLLPWGLNNEGQLNVPEHATNIIAIAAGHGHNLVLKDDGTLVAWGNNLYGSTNVPPDATNIVAIAAAGWHCLARRGDGTIFSWGWDNYGQTRVPPTSNNAQKMVAGLFHNLVLKNDGTIVCWGLNNHRQCLVPPSFTWREALSASWEHFLSLRSDGAIVANELDSGNPHTPVSVTSGATNVVMIAAGDKSLALQPDGNIIAWSSSGVGSKPASATNVVAIASGADHNLALRADSTIVGWGYNAQGQATGDPNPILPYTSTGMVMVAGETLSNIVAIAGGVYHSLALSTDGTVTGWGHNSSGQANGSLAGSNVVDIAAGWEHSLALRADGTVVAWGNNDYGQSNVPASATNVVAIAAGEYHNLALLADGTVVTWGENRHGQMNIPASVTNTVAIAAGWGFSLAMQSDGEVVGWGRYFEGHALIHIPQSETNLVAVSVYGQNNLALRANGTVICWGDSYHDPTNAPASATNVVAIAAGEDHNLALRADGTVVAWGYNGLNQTNTPASATNVVAIAAGYSHNLALRADGTVVGWGYNGNGQANGAMAGDTIVALAAGGYHSMALKANGMVVAWGFNSSSQTNTPASVVNAVAIAAGRSHSLALKADGTVICWGNNTYGQTNVPPSAINVVAIAAGYNHSLALRADGSVVAWGDGYRGQTIIPHDATDVIAMAGGEDHSLFLNATRTSSYVDNMGSSESFFARAHIPCRVADLILGVNRSVLEELDLDLHDKAIEVSGSKALIQTVLELGLPYTMERDDVLHGFFYGSESLADLEISRAFLQSENAKLEARPDAKPQVLTDVAARRYFRFAERLEDRLNDLQATGKPEIPRIVGHTLRLLNLLRDAWDTVPPPALELWNEGDDLEVILYGEPYTYYTLEYCNSLTNPPDWQTTSLTNLHDQDIITLNTNAPQRFYHVILP